MSSSNKQRLLATTHIISRLPLGQPEGAASLNSPVRALEVDSSGGHVSGVRVTVAMSSCALWLRLLVIAVDGVELTVVSCNQDWSTIPEI